MNESMENKQDLDFRGKAGERCRARSGDGVDPHTRMRMGVYSKRRHESNSTRDVETEYGDLSLSREYSRFAILIWCEG